MRRIFLFAIVGLLTIGALLPMTTETTRADDLTPAQTEQIKANCVSIKTSLNQLHASDALLRVNRGQIYESMSANLMDNFNERLSSNRLDNRAMTTVTNNYRTALNVFRGDYIAYEQKLSEVLRIDCTTQPNTFHTALLEARTLRNTVHEDVVALHRLIDDYRTSVGDFLLNYERIAE